MRDTKFRGKSDLSIEELEEAGVPHKNGWIVGNIIGDEKFPVIVGPIVDCSDEYFNTEWWASVIPETVGQYTELKDKKGVEIYEGDIFRGKSGFMIVKFENGAFITEYKFNIRGYEEVNSMHLSVTSRGAKVIGNIHDNPELLEVAK